MPETLINKWRILAVVMAGSLASSLDASMLNVSLPSIVGEFHSDISVAQWVPSIYRLIIVSLLLPFGRVGDMRGHHRVFLWGLLGFTIASVFAGFSQSMSMLIAFRIPQGIASAMKMSVGHAILTQVFSPAERGKVFGLYLASIGLATAIGPAFGGIVTEFLGWRFVFLIDVVIALATFLVARRVLSPLRAMSRQSGQSFDRIGAASLFLFLLSLLLLANRGSSWGWTSLPALGLITSVLLWGGVFFRTETHVSQPIINLRLFSILPFSLGNVAALFAFMSQHILYFLVPFYLQMVLLLPPKIVGLTMVALPLMFIIFSPLSGAMSDRIGTRPLTIAGPLLSGTSLLLMTQLDTMSTPLDVAWRLALFSFGMAVFQSPNNSSIMSSVPHTNIGIASGMINVSRNTGWLMGTVIGAAVLFALLPTYEAMQQETGLFLHALRNAYLVGATFAGIAVLATLTPRPSQERPS